MSTVVNLSAAEQRQVRHLEERIRDLKVQLSRVQNAIKTADAEKATLELTWLPDDFHNFCGKVCEKIGLLRQR